MEPQKEQIAPEIIQAIVAKATARGLSINDYLAELLGLKKGHGEPHERPFYETASAEEWTRAFIEWAASHNPNTPALTLEDVSRESIYEDR